MSNNWASAWRWGISLLLVLGLHLGLVASGLHWPTSSTQTMAAVPRLLVQLAPSQAVAKPIAPATVMPPQPSKPVLQPTPPTAKAPVAKPKPPGPVRPTAPSAVVPARPPTAAVIATDATQLAAARQQQRRDWQSRLLSHLQRYQQYPREARRRGQQGRNQLRFVLDAQGRVLDFELTEQAASRSLDQATLDMLHAAQPLPAPPPELLENGQIEVTAPFIYNLRKS